MVIPVGAGGKGYIEQRAAYQSGHASAPGSGQNYFRGPCPPTFGAASAPALPVLPFGFGIGLGLGHRDHGDDQFRK